MFSPQEVINNNKNNSNKMFKFKSYNVKKASEKNEKGQPLSSTATATATLKNPSSKEKKSLQQKKSNT